MERIILPDPAALADAAADLLAAEVHDAQALTLGIAGGSTPRAVHARLLERSIDWGNVIGWLPDERWVPPDHRDSNQLMARETLVEAAGFPLLAPDTLARNPTVAAQRYSDEVVPVLTDGSRRSIVMLGIGADGHTASLFPGTTALGVRGLAYVANFVPSLDCWRLTATFGLLAIADVVVFVAHGIAKADAIAGIAAGGDAPAARITARERVVWLLDEEAAARL